jgi:hypothetical protein
MKILSEWVKLVVVSEATVPNQDEKVWSCDFERLER